MLPGDPGRVQRLAARLDEVETASDAVTTLPRVLGRLDDTPVLVAATGMGGPSTVKTATSLLEAGCDTFLRVGGAGPVIDDVRVNDIVVATAAVRHDGASSHYLPEGWPAVAHVDLVDACRRAVADAGREAWFGVLHTKDSFFGELDPGSSPMETALREHWSAMQRLGVVASEMEAAALFAFATTHRVRAGAMVKINDPDGSLSGDWVGDEDLCELSVDALRHLIAADAAAGREVLT